MNKNYYINNSTKHQKIILTISFFVPFLIMLIYFMFRKMFPFGNSSIMTVDLGQQYIDFYSLYRNTLLHNWTNIFYSFTKGLGGNMYGTWAYYLFSPFNIILLFTPGKWLPFGVMIITLLKISFSGLSFSYFLYKTNWSDKNLIPIFGISYALNGYVIANMLNIMWLDALIALPLVSLGINYIFTKEKIIFYVIWLSFALITNFYMGYMICIFSCLFFIWKCICTFNYKYKMFKEHLIKFIESSLLAFGISAVVLIPTFYQITLSKGTYTDQNIKWIFEYNPIKMFVKFITGCFNFSQMPKGTPNIFIGSFALIGSILYLTDKIIPLKEKIATIIIELFLFLSMCFQPLDLFWHAMQPPIWYPYRFSYIVCFFLIMLSARYFKNFQKIKNYQLIIVFIILLSLNVYALWNINKFSFLSKQQIIISSLFEILFLILIIIRNNNKNLSNILIFLACISDMALNAVISLNNISYVPENEFANYINILKNDIKNIKPSKNNFYRISTTFIRSKNDAMQLNYYGTNEFNSMLNSNIPIFMNQIGQSASNNFIDYTNGTLFTDSLLDIKYILNQKKFSPLNSNAFRPDLYFDKLYSSNNFIDNYENLNALPLGFAANKDILLLKLFNNTPIVNQNDIGQNLSNNYNLLFTLDNNISVQYHNVYYYNNEYIIKNTNYPSWINIKFTPETNNPYYLSFGPISSNNQNVQFSINKKEIPQYNSNYTNSKILCICANKKHQIQNIKISLNCKNTWMQNYSLYYLNLKYFKQLVNKIKKHSLNINSFHNIFIKGFINKPSNNIIMTTIPYAKGWHILINGHFQKTIKIMNTFLGIKTSYKKCSITLFYIPPYFIISLLITIISIFISIKIIKYERN